MGALEGRVMVAPHARGLAGVKHPQRVTACALVLCVCLAWLVPVHAAGATTERGGVEQDFDARLDRLLAVHNHNPANVLNTNHVRFPIKVRVLAYHSLTCMSNSLARQQGLLDNRLLLSKRLKY